MKSKVSRGLGWRGRAASILSCAGLVLCLLASPAHLSAQVKKPISKDGLVKAIRLNGLSTRELVQQIQLRGVEFQVSPEVETELLSAGARPEVIAAARANYRPAPAGPSRPAGGRSTPNVPPGAPLSQNEVITLLQSGVGSARVEQFVEVRGVSFRVTPAISRQITAAGGTRSLVGVITANGPGTARKAQPSPAAAPPPSRRAPDYDDLTDQATAAFNANQADNALGLLQQAVRMDASQPTAYQLMGLVELYGKGDIASAERNMRAAIERGGSAVFNVRHDHDGSFGKYCEGSFFITKSGVSFKANDGKDTFEAEDSNIKEIATNSFVGANPFGKMFGGKGDVGAFHIKPRTKINGRDNFNFAPRTEKKEESKLIISLVKEYPSTQAAAPK